MSVNFYDVLRELASDERFDAARVGLGMEPFEEDPERGEPRRLAPVIRIENATPEEEAQLNEYARSRGLTVVPGRVRGSLLMRE